MPIKRLAAILITAALLLVLLPAGGCASGDWEGEWNRTGDATYSRAVMTISDAGGGGFTFSITLYNGNVAGTVTNMTAEYDDSSKTTARCSVPSSRVFIDFTLNDDGSLDVIYGNDLYSESSVGVIESDQFGFAASAFITGHFVKGEVDYLNATLYDAAVLTKEQDALVQELTTDASYSRLLDCFQTWQIIDDDPVLSDDPVDEDKNKDKHTDEIGGYVYYGANTMQQYAAVMIMYDDGTASVVVSLSDGSLVYYSNNAIYLDGSITPLPIKKWMGLYNAEQEKLRG